MMLVRWPVPPASRKRRSGKPRGRPKAAPPAADRSPFAIILDRRLTARQSGKARAMTVDEALQHRTYQDALAGNATARREILRMIAEREQWRAARQPRPERNALDRKFEPCDPRNADEAMLLLGIARHDPKRAHLAHFGVHLVLERWAVQAAFARRGGAPLRKLEMEEIERCTASDPADAPEALE